MKRTLLTLSLLCSGVGLYAQQIDKVTLAQFEERVRRDNDTLYVVNFWATWCAPCVKELPYFKQLSQEYAGRPVKFLLYSLDAQTNLEGTGRFLEKKKIPIECHLLAAGDPNVWINQIEPSWSGSIPATLLYQHGSKLSFHEGDFDNAKQLASFISNHK
jgi:thiol-disulfide isomerase/thioredoxin